MLVAWVAQPWNAGLRPKAPSSASCTTIFIFNEAIEGCLSIEAPPRAGRQPNGCWNCLHEILIWPACSPERHAGRRLLTVFSP